jgi:uncharacterized damage-inducible protein DinB
MIAHVERRSEAVFHPEVRPIRQLLDEIESLLVVLPPRSYAPIGSHIDSCLDLIEALISADLPRPIVYRATRPNYMKFDPADALRRTRHSTDALEFWPRLPLDTVVCVIDETAWPIDDASRGWSTLRAEMETVTSRIIHRQRAIAGMLADVGVGAPEGFGRTPVPPLRARSSVPPAWSLWELLDELSTVLMHVQPDRYATREFSRTSGSVGEHIRHCLDHIAALVASEPHTTLSYDLRQHGTAVESDPGAALREIMRLKASVARWPAQSLDQPIRVKSLLSASGTSVTGESTLGRELGFVISHTIHHQATIALLLERQGVSVPDRFGHSPSS